jgi:glycosyltransferase involved in cell wall biosynthesis
MVESFGAEATRFISEKDAGIADAWNKGLKVASGRYVLILNAGDEYADTALSKMKEVAFQHPGQIICSHVTVCTEPGMPLYTFRARPRELWRGMHLPHNWCAVPREIYEVFGGYRGLPYAMDFDWFHRYYRRSGASGFVVIDEPLGSYYLGGISDISFRQSFRMNEAILVENGTPRVIAGLLRILYTAKHALARVRWSAMWWRRA